MSMSKVSQVLQRVSEANMPDRGDLRFLLSLEDEDEKQELYNFADGVRKQYVGDGILLRGIVEFANYCNNGCLYCGLNKPSRTTCRMTFQVRAPRAMRMPISFLRCATE